MATDPLTPPSLEEIKKAIGLITHGISTHGEPPEAYAVLLLERLAACLCRGDALISRDDREQALDLATGGQPCSLEARRLLRLEM